MGWPTSPTDLAAAAISRSKLEIMRDSRLGTYGAMILLVSFAAKLSALAAIPDGYVVPSLIAAHALARGILPAMSLNLPYARKDGLARNAGQPDAATAAIAGGLALLIALLSLSWSNAFYAAVLAGLSGLGIAWLALRQIGGQTGDVLGGAEQVAETAILVLLRRTAGAAMNAQTNLWLIRHAPVDGPRGVIHGPDAPADLGDAAAFAALKARLPGGALAVCSPARRTRETAEQAGSRCGRTSRLSRTGFWRVDRTASQRTRTRTRRRPIANSGNRPASNRPPGGESFVDQIARASAGLALLPRGRSDRSSCIPAPSAPCSPSRSILRPSSALRFVIDPLSLTRIDRLEDGWRVVAVNQRSKD